MVFPICLTHFFIKDVGEVDTVDIAGRKARVAGFKGVKLCVRAVIHDKRLTRAWVHYL